MLDRKVFHKYLILEIQFRNNSFKEALKLSNAMLAIGKA
jgi:hypothetical protein